MEQQKQEIYDRLPPAKYPWMFTDNNNAEEEENCQIFYNLNDPGHSKYECRIPELLGKRIRGCFHGWMILSSIDHSHWSLWNPLTSKLVNLPLLILKDDGDYESITQCCLSAPPHHPTSVLVLTNTKKPTFVFCRLVCKRKRLIRWTEMSYVKQLERITGGDGSLLHSLACCDRKIYALNTDGSFGRFVVKVDILVKDREVLIKLSLFGNCPTPIFLRCCDMVYCLKGSRTELFFCMVGFHDKTKKTPGCVYSYKLDMTSRKCKEMDVVFKGLDMTGMDWKDTGMRDRYKDLWMTSDMWEEIEDLKDAIVFVNIARDFSVFYTTSKIASGFIHIRGIMGEILYSYHVKKKTITLSSLPFPTSNVLLWESRFGEAKPEDEEDKDREIVVRSRMNQEVELNESQLHRIPFQILETIMELCVGVEYMKFRATCKLCLLAAPLRQWSNEIASTRLQTYSLISPWLLVVDKNQGILTYTDPIFGDNYFMKNLQVSILYERLYCSRFGWLLFESSELECLVFFNPFTNDLRKLPDPGYNLETICFSAPPTSPDCMVVGFPPHDEWHVLFHFVAREPWWETIDLGGHPVSIRFPTFYGPDVYGLTKKGELFVLDVLGEEDYSYDIFEAEDEATKGGCSTSLPQYFLVKLDQHIVRVMVGDCGESVEVCKWNKSKEKWKKIDSIGRHTVFIDYTTCVCIEATIPQMENKIFFPRLHSKNGMIVFYSLETCRYHTFNGENIEENFADFIGTYHHLNPLVWIEPSWS